MQVGLILGYKNDDGDSAVALVDKFGSLGSETWMAQSTGCISGVWMISVPRRYWESLLSQSPPW